MQTHTKPNFFTLVLLISFASINAVLFTPALPEIARFFFITDETAQNTITLFLVGYALGQLIYGPLANRFGRKPALYAGISLQILSSIACILASYFHSYPLLLVGRFFLAIGSGVGLKMSFTLINECYEPKIASQKISYLMLAFAVMPGLSIALGGLLNTYYGWESCFYLGAIYGIVLLLLTTSLPETKLSLDKQALKLANLYNGYSSQFSNTHLILAALLMGGCTAFIYAFAAAAPFVAINLYAMTSADYGMANLLLPIGLIAGSLLSANASQQYALTKIVGVGISVVCLGAAFMIIVIPFKAPAILSLFFPMIIIYFGSSFIIANASAVAMSYVMDKAHGAAVMSFINMGFATLIVIGLGFFPLNKLLLPIVFAVLSLLMLLMYQLGFKRE